MEIAGALVFSREEVERASTLMRRGLDNPPLNSDLALWSKVREYLLWIVPKEGEAASVIESADEGMRPIPPHLRSEVFAVAEACEFKPQEVWELIVDHFGASYDQNESALETRIFDFFCDALNSHLAHAEIDLPVEWRAKRVDFALPICNRDGLLTEAMKAEQTILLARERRQP
jgi:hypothetical protein